MFKIGILSQNQPSQYQAEALKSRLNSIETAIHTFENLSEIFNGLQSATISTAVMPLVELPTQLPKGIVITALSDRQNTSTSLIVPLNNTDESQLFSLKTGSKVLFQQDILRGQFQEFRSDLELSYQDLKISEILNKVKNGNFDACVLPTESLSFLNLEENKWHIQAFNPKELIPLAGQGVTAFLAAEDDLATRRTLKVAFNDVKLPSGQPISAVTNIERRLKQLFNDSEIAVYCEIDRLKNYHIWASAVINGELKKARISQSTSFELAERCFEKLNS